MNYPANLNPTSFEPHMVNDAVVEIPLARILFNKWNGEPIAETFGGKGLIDCEGIPMFAELAIQRLAVKDEWNARWIETYAMKGKVPRYFTSWGDVLLAQQIQDPILDIQQVELLKRIAHANDDSYSGCWDVMIWNKDATIFVESKRSKKDRFQKTQDRWLSAGLKSGLNHDQFLIVQWDFE